MKKSNPPAMLHDTKGHKEIYDELTKSGPLKGMESKDMFMLAVAYGFNNKKRKEKKGSREGQITRWDYLKDADLNILRAIAIKESKDLMVIDNNQLIAQIAEDYANGGIEILKKEIYENVEHGSYEKRTEKKLRNLISNVVSKSQKSKIT